MQLEPECLILAFVIIERMISAVGNVVRMTTVRPLFLVAATVAAKVYFDETVFCSDMCDGVCSNRISLRTLIYTEAVFLNAIRFKVVVSTQAFARYYFALADLRQGKEDPQSPAQLQRMSSAPCGLVFVG